MSEQKNFPKAKLTPPNRAKGYRKSFILLGGFLGAGKTTCLIELVKWLKIKRLRCGIITNDQGNALVDTMWALETRQAVREITGGCFCCRSEELVKALRDLEKQTQPDVFLAEPVGSCTDLAATVLLPLEQIYKTGFHRAPMSVILDAKRVWNNCFVKTRRQSGFSRDVRYIYLKQMEEAEILVVNKVDLLPIRERKRLVTRLKQDFPRKQILMVSARTGEGMDEWFRMLLMEESKPDRIVAMDYTRYGKGEALMGWYNATFALMPGPWLVDGNAFLLELAEGIQADFEKAGVEIAHFKMSLKKAERRKVNNGLAVVSTVRNGSPPELSLRMARPTGKAELLINLRAEAAPAKLANTVARRLKGLPIQLIAKTAFRPGQPKPTHRAITI